MSVVDTARFLALLSAAEEDAIISVMDAKYTYEFWRPFTAIRNGDIDDNPATERQADWLPIDNTPLHPEYPCAHCIVSSTVASAIKIVLGSDEIPEVALTSPFAPGVTHRFTNLTAYSDEVAAARIFAGFHYRFSTIVGKEMGRKIGARAAATVMQPVQAASAR
jgi:PAP2 superfamily protein